MGTGRRYRPGAGLVLALLLAAAPAAALTVAVSIPPQQWFVRQIAGPETKVLVVVAPGASPATFDPSPAEVARLARTDLYLTAGIPLEANLLPRLRSIAPDLVIVPPPPAPRIDGEPDPHLWLSPRLAVALADSTAAGLCRLDPAGAERYRRRAAAVGDTLRALSAELSRLLAPLRGQTLLVFHPAFGHFAAEFGLHQEAIEHGGLEPSPRRLVQTLRRAREQGVTTIFVEPQFSSTLAGNVARQTGMGVAVLDPLAPDYPDNLRRIARTILAHLAPETADDGAADGGGGP